MAMTIEQEREAFEKWMSEAHPSYPLTSHEGRYVLTSVRNLWAAFSSGCAHITQPAQAVDARAEAYAERLARALWSKHYAEDAPQWEPLTGDLLGLLSQIDNMTTGLTTRALSAEKAGWVGDGLQPEDSRCPATYRREEAVKILLGFGWKWNGSRWVIPASTTPDKEG